MSRCPGENCYILHSGGGFILNLKRSLFAALCLTASAAFADTWSFETPALASGTYDIYGVGGSIDGWTATGTTCGTNCILRLQTNYVEAGGALQFVAQDGAASLDLTGAGNTGQNGITRTFNLTAGRNYTLSFWIADINGANYAAPSSLTLTVGGSGPMNYTTTTTGGVATWTMRSYSFTATGSTDISFVNMTPVGDNYMGLDNVSLNAVPEPAGIAALSAGALGLLLSTVRRRNRT